MFIGFSVFCDSLVKIEYKKNEIIKSVDVVCEREMVIINARQRQMAFNSTCEPQHIDTSSMLKHSNKTSHKCRYLNIFGAISVQYTQTR